MERLRDAWGTLIDVWKSGQVGLPAVTRWSKYVEAGRTRTQDSLQHSYGIALLGRIFVERMKPYLTLDADLLVTALLLHDHGEGEIGRDTLYVDKTADGDLAEYLAFRKRFEPLGGETFAAMHGAFLLQFAMKPHDGFPADAVSVMEALRVAKRSECLAFDALERWDYLLFALEQYLERGNEVILTHVLRNQIPKLDRLARDLYGFRQLFWTDEIAADCRAFVDAHPDVTVERKSGT